MDLRLNHFPAYKFKRAAIAGRDFLAMVFRVYYDKSVKVIIYFNVFREIALEIFFYAVVTVIIQFNGQSQQQSFRVCVNDKRRKIERI